MHRPLRSLKQGNWFKLICGASYQHLPAVRSLALAYTLAGADCIDVAADPAVIYAAQSALRSAMSLQESAQQRGFYREGLPWIMVSLNDGEDPHFRKAAFDPAHCPPECARPCETICPAQAIVLSQRTDRELNQTQEASGVGQAGSPSGVIDDQCYGCGRCVPICPFDRISTRSYVFSPVAVAPLVLSGVDAVEIHTQVGRLADFKRLWQAIEPFLATLKLVAISCPDGEGFVDYLWSLYEAIAPLPCALIWQTDGRPMSGDIGNGTTLAAIKLGQKALAANLPGYIQLAGGTNNYTVSKLRAMGLLSAQQTAPSAAFDQASDNFTTASIPWKRELSRIAGIAYGSFARTLLAPLLEQLEQLPENSHFASLGTVAEPDAPVHSLTPFHSEQSLEQQSAIRLEDSRLLWQAVQTAHTLVSQIKQPSMNQPISAFAPSG